MTTMSRRTLLAAVGLGAAGAAAAAAGGNAVAAAAPQPRYSFLGPRQPGIITPQQRTACVAAFSLVTASRADLVALLKAWTSAASSLMAGQPVGPAFPPAAAIPDDTGEAVGLSASNLTVTFGFGPSLFRTASGVDRFGIAGAKPASLRLATFPGDQLDPALVGGDLCVQACSDDPQVSEHAVRMLARIARGVARIAWLQSGFLPNVPAGTTPRNLFGFKDGTANNFTPAELEQFVWASSADGQAWMAGGTYLAVRHINMLLEDWDEETIEEQNAVFGRAKDSGAPLSGGTERTPPDFRARGNDGRPLIPPDSHVALSAQRRREGQRILRRGYNMTNGVNAEGRQRAGLLFLAFARDLERQFVPMQQRLSESDRMNEYVRYVGHSVFAIPPGVTSASGYVGQTLLG